MRLQEPAGEVIWQYTSAQGVLGILSPGDAMAQAKRMGMGKEQLPPEGAFSMRFTDARYLNDPMELRFGADMLAEAVAAAKAELTDLDGDEATEIDGVIAWLREIERDPSTIYRDAGGTFVACFSRDRDSLSQWRGYAGRPGYAVGFDSIQLRKQLFAPIAAAPEHPWESEFHFRPIVQDVIYGRPAAQNFFEHVAAPSIVGAPILFTAPSAPVPRRVIAEAALAGVKQKAYEVEHEVRAFMLAGPTPWHRELRAGAEGSLGIIQYITASRLFSGGPHGLPPLITEILVGPGEDIIARRRGAEQAVAVHVGSGAIPVECSEFQYRG